MDDARAVLEASGFATFIAKPSATSLHFEDISILGQLRLLESAGEILANWQWIQDQFLEENAKRFMHDTTKAWNLYTVLLTAEAPTNDVAGKLFSIEDDFRGTRKIAQCGITSQQDVVAALAPILPLQNILAVGLVDASQRLLERLGTVSPVLQHLATGASPESIAASLLGNE